MYKRLIVSDWTKGQPLIFVVAFSTFMVFMLSRVPWILEHTDLARSYMSADSKRVVILAGAVAMFIAVVLGLLMLGVGTGLLASLYGKEARNGVVVASPLGLLGVRGQRLRLAPGEVRVRLIDEPPRGPMYRYGVQRVLLSQGGQTLEVFSSVRFRHGIREELLRWMKVRGLVLVFEGDANVLS